MNLCKEEVVEDNSNLYSVSYFCEGKEYNFYFHGGDFDDAAKRLEAIRKTVDSKVWKIVSVAKDSTNVCDYFKKQEREIN